jgi:hypothetical protein
MHVLWANLYVWKTNNNVNAILKTINCCDSLRSTTSFNSCFNGTIIDHVYTIQVDKVNCRDVPVSVGTSMYDGNDRTLLEATIKLVIFGTMDINGVLSSRKNLNSIISYNTQ